MSLNLFTNFIYPTEVHDVAKLFFNDVVLTEEQQQADVCLLESQLGNEFCFVANYLQQQHSESVNVEQFDDLHKIRLRKRHAKICLFNLLQKVTGKVVPWGSLTGIRPTKLAVQIQSEGLDWKQTFSQVLGVSQPKVQLVEDILATQGNLRQHRPNSANLYVGIPFCVSRCSYCSFTSGELERLKKYVEPYVDALCLDVSQTLQFAKQQGMEIRNVYFGGGTPTSLTAEQLDRVMSLIDVNPIEYTVEAGRPDTIDEAKLQVLKKHGVHRISINPQTFNQSVLDEIGRKHTVQDIYDKYHLAKQYGFVVNMDLIAGLPTETYQMFCHSVDCAIALGAENITVHTLALKHGTLLKHQNYYADEQSVAQMVDYSHKALYQAGYLPYYMYRQKYVMDNLENVGFCKPQYPCLYNIDIMEEVANILACGTNAISKKVIVGENRIERQANAKDVITYIQRTQDFVEKKIQLFR